MLAYYLNQNVNFKEPKYEKYTYWNNNLLQHLQNTPLFENWHSINIPLSSQFQKYFSNPDIISFLQNYKDYYLISVIYQDPNKKYYDTLPCFTETLRKNEPIEFASKRLLKEELFSDSDIKFLNKYKFKKQNIYSYHQNINNIQIKDIVQDDEDEIIDKTRKINLILYSNNLQQISTFISEWRSRRHNLGTESERLYMIDLCVFKVNDILNL